MVGRCFEDGGGEDGWVVAVVEGSWEGERIEDEEVAVARELDGGRLGSGSRWSEEVWVVGLEFGDEVVVERKGLGSRRRREG